MSSCKIAEVVICTRVKSLDRVFAYLADEELGLESGMRVEVPFGYGNKKAVGFFTGYIENTDYDGKLKKIIRRIDDKPMIAPSGIELAKYVQKTCFCTLSEAMRLLLPPSIKVNYETMVLPAGENISGENLTKLQVSALEILKAAGESVEINKLMQAAGIKSKAVINRLAKQKLVVLKQSLRGEAKAKTQKYLTLNIEENEVAAAVAYLSKTAKKAAAALEVLAEHKSLAQSELCDMADCSPSAAEYLINHGYAESEARQIERLPFSAERRTSVPHRLNEEQLHALNEIEKSLNSKENQNILLHGVTGSGKTEVFLQAAQKCIENGRNVIILVPEIALTPQMAERFVDRFGDRVALLHSGLSVGERFDQWHKIKNGEVNLVVGARSAVFAPFENIGLIVVDEEQETSYKADSTPKYNAVNIALMRGRQCAGTVIFASATPSVDSYYNAEKGRYKLITLKRRYNNASLPEVKIADMRTELVNGNKSPISRMLAEEIERNIKADEQTILFLNRRGYSTFVSCRNCGYVAKCPHCSVSLTYHAAQDVLKCHYCGYTSDNLFECPECGSLYIKYFGTGTQKIEETLKQMFPGISLLRMDADTTSKKLSHQQIFWKFRNENINVLLGTQMVSKGLDFPNVTLVGVLAADAMLCSDDFRAGERTFSQLTQVCGRAGRGSKAGRAVIQTYSPGDNVIRLAAKQDYISFYRGEIALRKQMANPPFMRVICIVFSGDNKEKTMKYALKMHGILYDALMNTNSILYNVCDAPIEKIRGEYRYRILLKSNEAKILDILHQLNEIHVKGKSGILMDIAINPGNML